MKQHINYIRYYTSVKNIGSVTLFRSYAGHADTTKLKIILRASKHFLVICRVCVVSHKNQGLFLCDTVLQLNGRYKSTHGDSTIIDPSMCPLLHRTVQILIHYFNDFIQYCLVTEFALCQQHYASEKVREDICMCDKTQIL